MDKNDVLFRKGLMLIAYVNVLLWFFMNFIVSPTWITRICLLISLLALWYSKNKIRDIVRAEEEALTTEE